MIRAAVITFPGSNCDRDLAVAMEAVFGQPVLRVWHQETELPKLDLIGVPGGFSYGDYLRCGAMAARSPVMREVVRCAPCLTSSRALEPSPWTTSKGSRAWMRRNVSYERSRHARPAKLSRGAST